MRRRLEALSPEQRRQFIANGLDPDLPPREPNEWQALIDMADDGKPNLAASRRLA